MVKVSFYDISYMPEPGLTYAVICARFDGRWVFIRHRIRKTYEIPGGHIESDETPVQAARRELAEETGAEEFTIECVATYSVDSGAARGYGRLFYAEIVKMGEVTDTSEIAEVILSDELPQPHQMGDVLGPVDPVQLPGQLLGIDVCPHTTSCLTRFDDLRESFDDRRLVLPEGLAQAGVRGSGEELEQGEDEGTPVGRDDVGVEPSYRA